MSATFLHGRSDTIATLPFFSCISFLPSLIFELKFHQLQFLPKTFLDGMLYGTRSMRRMIKARYKGFLGSQLLSGITWLPRKGFSRSLCPIGEVLAWLDKFPTRSWRGAQPSFATSH